MEANNMKAMREAVKSLMDNLQIHAMMPCEQITMNRAEVCAMIEDCRAALALPRRQCDVGTAEEQYSRMFRKCYEWTCRDCKSSDKDFRKCALSWAQTPYEAQEDKEGK